ncbi:MAG: alpha/beta hydrolase [Clostridia bacterium]|nr:alpha/beta hydrolase [Clostridia bacterium]MBR4442284.1 alpha/beta hydrolase [Clostridia bacterium]
MIERWKTPVRPITGREPRTVYVYLPEAAENDPDARFPVLYMFDGHNVFFDEDATYGKSWGMGDYLDGTGTPLIVVAVDCNHRPPNGRLSEYSPFSFDDGQFGHVEGQGQRFMDWLTGTLKPRIDRRYPTLPQRETTFIAGSSMGGLMSLYAVSAYNAVFSRAAALSPSVWLVREKMIPLLRQTRFAPGTVVYMDYGSREMGNHKGMLRCFTQTADALLARGVLLTSRIVPNGDHCEACWEEQIPFFMNILTYNRE